jgi:hypothetical protein
MRVETEGIGRKLEFVRRVGREFFLLAKSQREREEEQWEAEAVEHISQKNIFGTGRQKYAAGCTVCAIARGLSEAS